MGQVDDGKIYKYYYNKLLEEIKGNKLKDIISDTVRVSLDPNKFA